MTTTAQAEAKLTAPATAPIKAVYTSHCTVMPPSESNVNDDVTVHAAATHALISARP